MIATGAGSAARHALGTSVFGGMIAATVLGVLFIPVLFVVSEAITERRKRSEAKRAVAPMRHGASDRLGDSFK